MSSPFCPGPYFDQDTIAPCMLDTILAVVMLIVSSTVTTVWWILHHRHTNVDSHDDATQPLLVNGGDDVASTLESSPDIGDALHRIRTLSPSTRDGRNAPVSGHVGWSKGVKCSLGLDLFQNAYRNHQASCGSCYS